MLTRIANVFVVIPGTVVVMLAAVVTKLITMVVMMLGVMLDFEARSAALGGFIPGACLGIGAHRFALYFRARVKNRLRLDSRVGVYRGE